MERSNIPELNYKVNLQRKLFPRRKLTKCSRYPKNANSLEKKETRVKKKIKLDNISYKIKHMELENMFYAPVNISETMKNINKKD